VHNSAKSLPEVQDVNDLSQRVIDVGAEQRVINGAIESTVVQTHACIRARRGHFAYSR